MSAFDQAWAMLKEDRWDLGDWENTPRFLDLPEFVQEIIRRVSPKNAFNIGNDFEENPTDHQYVDWWNEGGSGKQQVIDKAKEELLREWDFEQKHLYVDRDAREAAGFTEKERDEWYAHAYNITNEGSVGGFGTQIIACPNCGNTHLMRSRDMSTRFHTRPATEIGQKREGYYRQNPGKETAYCPSCRTEVKGEWQERLSEGGYSDISPSTWRDLANPAGIPTKYIEEHRSKDLHNTNPIITNLLARIHQYEVEEEKRMQEAVESGTITMAEYQQYLDERYKEGSLRDRTPQDMAVEAGMEAMREEPEIEPELPVPELPEPEPVLEVADEEEAAAKKVYDDMKWEDWRRD